MPYVTCPRCGYYQAAQVTCCECSADMYPHADESDADLLDAVIRALEDDTTDFYVWTPGTPLLSTRESNPIGR